MDNNRYCVIMAGGIGSRFWPFSRNARPKQFLEFLGTGRSLLQMTFDRFARIIPQENILVVTNKMYKSLVLEQLPMINPAHVLAEPARRNTAPCIAYATNFILAKNPEAVMVVAPSDHLITREDEFVAAVGKGLDFVTGQPVLLTLGIKPSRPETGYGYIQVESGNEDGFRRVKTFTEKPNAELAKVFMESGEFFWNSGVFLWKASTIQQAFEDYLPDIVGRFTQGRALMGTDREEAYIEEVFPGCQNISIDYGIMEHAQQVYVLCGDFGWSDLGTWGSLYEQLDKDGDGNAHLSCRMLSYDSQDNIVVLPKGKLAVLQGLKGYIVVESDDALLICRKSEEQRIRQFVNDVNMLPDGNQYI
ncbi:MAG: mannose-1-phosphate guanylyltransferase [Paludibacteraceae bacterium]|nr:mannose-1-phosphate guanylyltransferase [Paludibacteraceae bacterium]